MAGPGKGLEGVVAAETAISDIDGKKGLLLYVGYDIHDLAENATFEETIYLLHHLELPIRAAARRAEGAAGSRARAERVRDGAHAGAIAKACAPMAMLRTAVSASSAKDPDG